MGVFFCLAFCVIALTLVSASLATSDYIVLYSENEKELQVTYESNYDIILLRFLMLSIYIFNNTV